jgi:hypothetical protein
MNIYLFPALFLLAGGEPQTTTQPAATEAPATAAAPVAETKPEPKMVCKYEHATGSRLSKTKVCRPEGQVGDDQSMALRRSLDKIEDRSIDPGSFGN